MLAENRKYVLAFVRHSTMFTSVNAMTKIRLYLEDTKAATEATKAFTPTLVGAATTLNTKIKPATDALADLYKTIFYSSDGRNATGAFDISKLDPSQLADIKENFLENQFVLYKVIL